MRDRESALSRKPPVRNYISGALPGFWRRLLVAFAAFSLVSAGLVMAQPFLTLHSLAAGSTTPTGVYTNADGAHPFAGLVLAGTNLYGTAQDGGSSGNGTVYSVSADGKAFTILHNFTPTSGPANINTDGAIPQGRLTVVSNALYGTTIAGGSGGVGTIFAVNIDGGGFATLHNFTGIQATGEGAYPAAGLFRFGNTLYGTTSEGGTAGNGTVFAVNLDGTGFKTLYSFSASYTNVSGLYTNSDGARPSAGVVVTDNGLYGTAAQGGSAGRGTLFAMTIDGANFINLHNFTGLSDGAYPYADVVVLSNLLYGTTQFGGSSGNGTVFAYDYNGPNLTTLHNFTGLTDGARPTSELVLSNNILYGTTQFGGSTGNGTVFAVTTNGATFTTLYSFNGADDGSSPYAGLVLSNNRLYGTATKGGAPALGTVFSLSVGGAVNRPALTILPSGSNVVLLWPINATGFTLQSTTNLVSPTIWTPVLTLPVIGNGYNAVTNSNSALQQYFRLMQ
jgi:uncharacterized repeat protein (TIGR03803 family)